MTLYDELFSNAVEIEQRIGELYSRYAKAFAGEEDMARFFARLAEEEAHHARLLGRPGLAAAIKDPSISPLPLVRAQRDLLVLLSRYHEEAERPVTAQEALRNAFRLENSLPERLLGRIRNLVGGEAAGDFQKLSAESLEHSRRVREFARSKDIRFSSEPVA